MRQMTLEHIRKMQEGRLRAAQNVKNGIKTVKQGPVATAQPSQDRPRGMRAVPEKYKARYLRALSGKSMRAGVSSFCAECVGWEGLPDSVRSCTAPGCPLFPYRPYRA